MATESGYSNQKKKGISQFKSILHTGSSQYGAPIAQKTLYDISVLAQPIVSVTDVIGPDGQVQFWNIEITGHGAVSGDVLRMVTGTLVAWEFPIMQVIDANNFYILPTSDSAPIATETAKVMRWITTRSDSQGSQTVTSGPVSFLKDATQTTVTQDTVTPALSEPLPSLILDSNGVPVDWSSLIRTYAPLARIVVDYFTTPITSAAYVELLASVGVTPIKKVQIFSATGTALYLAFGGAGSEVDSFIIIPGGNGVVDLDIPAGTRLSARAIVTGQTASGLALGESLLLINLLG